VALALFECNPNVIFNYTPRGVVLDVPF